VGSAPSPPPRALQPTDLSRDEVPLDAPQTVNEHDAVQVIHLMLERSCEKIVPFVRVFGPRRVKALDHGARWAENGRVESRNAQAALFFQLHAAALDEDRIDHHEEIRRICSDRDVHDEHAQRHAYLSSRKTYPWRRMHGFDHVIDKPAHLIVYRGNGKGGRVEELLAVSKNGPKRQETLN